MIGTLDPRDIIYLVVGLAILVLTFQPVLARFRLVNLPLFYIAAGAAFAQVGIGLVDPLGAEWETKAIEHAAELIVIISLAGAGLAIDTPEGWRNWNPTWRLLAISMPLTIAAVAWLGAGFLGLGIASALLLAAVIAPTDPVLARSVQVSPPGREEKPMEVALTAEAGLNDGLAFPFVYLAIGAATYGVAGMFEDGGWFWTWLSWDFAYRIIAGLVVGWFIGRVIATMIYSSWGDAQQGAWNSITVVLASTFIAYGLTEAIDGYGFLAVFCAARAGRALTRGTAKEGYEKYVHYGADQFEGVLLGILLLWLGTFIGAGGLIGLRWQEVTFALALILVIRPVTGYAALLFQECSDLERRNVAFFGIRGMGSIFYIAYAQTHADFAEIDTVWRIVAVTILASVAIHGYATCIMLSGEDSPADVHPYKDDTPSEDGKQRL